MKKRSLSFSFIFRLSLALLPAAGAAQAAPPQFLDGLHGPASVVRDTFGVPHIRALNDHDLYFLQGYVHAQDRLFQMDTTRRAASGTLAELLGPDALQRDVETRTLGIRRAAQRSLAVISAEARAAAEAYADGVNAFLASRPTLPPEYGALEITRVAPWTALDVMTVAKSITFELSFDLADLDHTIALQTYAAVFGLEAGGKLFSEDLWRAEPFTHATTIPDATAAAPAAPQRAAPQGKPGRGGIEPAAASLVKAYADRVRGMPFFKQRMDKDRRPGSNEWAVSGRNTANGAPLVANDPHLALTMPSIFYPIHLTSTRSDAMGSGFAGVPAVVVGQTRGVAWGATVSYLDVTDFFNEQIVPDPASPSGLSTVFQGRNEPVVAIPESYRVNIVGDGVKDDVVPVPAGATPPATLIAPRRNNGPIVQFDLASGRAISIQYTGFSGTREIDAFLIWNRANSLEDFEKGLPYFDSGTENFAVADTKGAIAYFAASEVPLREDLQAGAVTGLPPWFVREGSGGNEWLPLRAPQPGQATPYEILPLAEMPHLVNPSAGWFVNANNDPLGLTLDNNPLNQLRPGGGLYYLGHDFDAGFRAGRITQLLTERLRTGRVSAADMQTIQADVTLPDAQYFTPYVTRALARAQASGNPALLALAARANIAEAVGRLAAWGFTAPTGIDQGYDASDVDGRLSPPGSREISESVAATIYSAWRSEFLRNTIDATLEGVPFLPAGVTLPKPPGQMSMTALKTLLERPTPGVGASGLNFFNVPGVASAEDRRDILILKSVGDALARLAGPDFAAAFGRSANQNDYRWGVLHRVTLAHPLGSLFNAPPAFGAFPDPLGAALPGFPTDGGFGSVDAANHDPRANGVNDFMFTAGPADRFVASADRWGVNARSAWPGGTSAIPGNRFYLNLLPGYLTNDALPLLFSPGELASQIDSVSIYAPRVFSRR